MALRYQSKGSTDPGERRAQTPVTSEQDCAVRTGEPPTSPAKLAFVLAVAMRLVLTGLGILMGPFLHLDPRLVRSNAFTDALIPQNSGWPYALLGVWQRFDTLWYVHIAQAGYDRPAAVVFYPTYPLLIRAVTSLVGDALAAALIVSTTASFFSLWGIQILLRLDETDAVAARAAILLSVWPATFIFWAAYPDSLLLALAVWAIYSARREMWAAAAILGVLCAATKAAGAMVAIPIAVAAWRLRARTGFVAAGVIGVAAGSYPSIVGLRNTGMLEIYVRYWGTTTSGPWTTAQRAIQAGSSGDPIALLNLSALVLFACALAFPRVRLEYRLYAIALLTLFLTKNTYAPLQSTMRYLLFVFPAFGVFVREIRSEAAFDVLVCIAFLANVCLAWTFFEWMLIV